MKKSKRALGATMILLSVGLIISIIGIILLGIFGKNTLICKEKEIIVVYICNCCLFIITIITISLIIAIIICIHLYTKYSECENEESSIKKLMLANLITSNKDSQSISYAANGKTITIKKEKK